MDRPERRAGKSGDSPFAHAHGKHRPEPPVLHLRHHGNAEDGAARLRLSPGPHPHRKVLAERAGRRPPPHRGGHRLGQGGVGQDLRPVAVRLRRLRLRLRQVRPRRPSWRHCKAQGDLVLRAAHHLPLLHQGGLLPMGLLRAALLHGRGGAAEPRGLRALPGPHGHQADGGLRPDRDDGGRRRLPLDDAQARAPWACPPRATTST